MDDTKFQLARAPLGSDTKIVAHSVSFAGALVQKDRSRHSAITTGLYSYHRYKVWTEKVRNAFEKTK